MNHPDFSTIKLTGFIDADIIENIKPVIDQKLSSSCSKLVIDLENTFLALYESGKLAEIGHINSSDDKTRVIRVYYDPKNEDLKKGAENEEKEQSENANVEELKQILNKIT